MTDKDRQTGIQRRDEQGEERGKLWKTVERKINNSEQRSLVLCGALRGGLELLHVSKLYWFGSTVQHSQLKLTDSYVHLPESLHTQETHMTLCT